MAGSDQMSYKCAEEVCSSSLYLTWNPCHCLMPFSIFRNYLLTFRDGKELRTTLKFPFFFSSPKV